MLGISDYDPDLGPWRFNVSSAWGTDRLPVAAAVFTERGIYRPGEPVYAKAIVRAGPLGALASPARGDSLRWVFRDRADQATGEAGTLREAAKDKDVEKTTASLTRLQQTVRKLRID